MDKGTVGEKKKRKVFSISAVAAEQRKVIEETVYSTAQQQTFSIDHASPARNFALTEYESLTSSDYLQYKQLKKVQASMMVDLDNSKAKTSSSSAEKETEVTKEQLPACKRAHIEIQKACLEMDFLTEVMASIRDRNYLRAVNVQTELQQEEVDHGLILPTTQRLHHITNLYQNAHTTITSATQKSKELVESRRKSLVSLAVVKEHWTLSVVNASNLSSVLDKRYCHATDLTAINCAMIPQSQLHTNNYLVPLDISQEGVQIVEQDRLQHKFAQHRTLQASIIAADTREVLVTKTVWNILEQYNLHDMNFNTQEDQTNEQRQGERIHMHCYKRRHESFAQELFRELKEECNNHCAKLVVESLEKATQSKQFTEDEWISHSAFSRNHLVVISLSEHRLEIELNGQLNIQFELVPLKVKEQQIPKDKQTYQKLTSVMDLIMLELRLNLLEKMEGTVHHKKVSNVEPVLSKAWRGKKYQLSRQNILPSNIVFLQDIILKVFACQCAAMKVRAVLESCQQQIRQLLPSLSITMVESAEASQMEVDSTIGSCIDTFHFQFVIENDCLMSITYSPTALVQLRLERKTDVVAPSKDLKQWRQSTELYEDIHIASFDDLEYAILSKTISYSIR